MPDRELNRAKRGGISEITGVADYENIAKPLIKIYFRSNTGVGAGDYYGKRMLPFAKYCSGLRVSVPRKADSCKVAVVSLRQILQGELPISYYLAYVMVMYTDLKLSRADRSASFFSPDTACGKQHSQRQKNRQLRLQHIV
jgi:hypothetical protein